MLRRLGVALLILPLLACGGSPTAPSPDPPPPTETPTPAPPVAPDPAHFDATFNAQLVHDAYDHPGALQQPRLLSVNPSIYLQSSGLDAAMIAAIEQEARTVVPMFSGGMLTVARFETGQTARPIANGWIVAEQINDTSDPSCAHSDVGAPAGHVWLNMAHPDTCTRPLAHVFGHELGHALGFYHVADPACLMSLQRPLGHSGLPCDKERYHAGLAYQTNGAYHTSGGGMVD